MSRGWWLGALGAAAVVAVVAVAAAALIPAPTVDDRATEAPAPAATGGGPVGERVPALTFTTFEGAQATLLDYRGRPLVLNFWASWCPPCVAEMRDAFEPAHQRYGEQVAFLGVNQSDTREAAEQIVAQTGVTYDLAEDPNGTLFFAFGGFGMPTTAFIDEDGVIVHVHTGALTEDQLQRLIAELLL